MTRKVDFRSPGYKTSLSALSQALTLLDVYMFFGNISLVECSRCSLCSIAKEMSKASLCEILTKVFLFIMTKLDLDISFNSGMLLQYHTSCNFDCAKIGAPLSPIFEFHMQNYLTFSFVLYNSSSRIAQFSIILSFSSKSELTTNKHWLYGP